MTPRGEATIGDTITYADKPAKVIKIEHTSDGFGQFDFVHTDHGHYTRRCDKGGRCEGAPWRS